jgi:AAA+ superfamily predicted ATPase
MENNITSEILESIGKIHEDSNNCKLTDTIFTRLDPELTLLSGYLGTTKTQSLLAALVFSLGYNGNTVTLDDLVMHLDCNPVRILTYRNDLNALRLSGIFANHRSKDSMRSGTGDSFAINETIRKAILNNRPVPPIREEPIHDIYQLMEKLYSMVVPPDEEGLPTGELFQQAGRILAAGSHLPLISKMNTLIPDIPDTYLFFHLVWVSFMGSRSADLSRTLAGIYDNITVRMQYKQKILSGENLLVKNNLIETAEGNLFNNIEIKLTDQSKRLLQEYGLNMFIKNKKRNNIIHPSGIPFRELIFKESEMEQLSLLRDLLAEEKFRETQQRLAEKNLPKGVTVLLHGAPGTGKTEIVRQMARETGRELMKVEISQAKSMWFGESEKIIKSLFTDYKCYAGECERTPILFFNEADAIFARRMQKVTSSPARTENVMQNILLEEMEQFEGILIATTNLAGNFDSAFERRFLFKIEFHLPDTPVRARIWKSRLPSLPLEDCTELARKFDLSGGQIDNVLRKNEIREIVHGNQCTFEYLITCCSEEKWVGSNSKIGFTKA